MSTAAYRGITKSSRQWKIEPHRKAEFPVSNTLKFQPYGITTDETLRVLCAMGLMCGSAWSAGDFYLKDGDRVVFYGDSITDQRLYTVLTEDFVVSRYPKLNVTFIHSGWGGDKVTGGGGGQIQVRLQRDVIAYRPTVMTVMLGMNDGQYRPETEDTDKVFFDGYKNIINTVRAALPGIRITAIEPSPYDDVTRAPLFTGGYNAVLQHFGKWICWIREGSQPRRRRPEHRCCRNANECEERAAGGSAENYPRPGASEHRGPSDHGGTVIESLERGARGVRPSRLEFRITNRRLKARITRKSPVLPGMITIPFSGIRLDDALPLPFNSWSEGNPAMALAIKSSDVTAALNAEPLRVTGLSDRPYVLSIDGQTIGTFNSNSLASGINLAVLDTPMTKQAKRVFQLTVQHAQIHQDKWRSLQVPLAEYNLPETKSAMDALDALDKTLIRKQHESAQPQPHHFELAPAA